MKIQTLVITLALSAGATTSFAQIAESMGTWKLNESKSAMVAGAPKNTLAVYETSGDSTKVTIDGIAPGGAPSHSVWIGKFDGKDYPVTGDAIGDTRAMSIGNKRTFALTEKKAGAVVITGTVKLSPDGKTRTTTLHMTDPSGKKITSRMVYDKQ
jgi:hypothetical protein